MQCSIGFSECRLSGRMRPNTKLTNYICGSHPHWITIRSVYIWTWGAFQAGFSPVKHLATWDCCDKMYGWFLSTLFWFPLFTWYKIAHHQHPYVGCFDNNSAPYANATNRQRRILFSFHKIIIIRKLNRNVACKLIQALPFLSEYNRKWSRLRHWF